MSDDSPQSGSNRGRRVLRAVRRRLKRVEIETHLIRADLAQFEAVQETGLAETLRHELSRRWTKVLRWRTSRGISVAA